MIISTCLLIFQKCLFVVQTIPVHTCEAVSQYPYSGLPTNSTNYSGRSRPPDKEGGRWCRISSNECLGASFKFKLKGGSLLPFPFNKLENCPVVSGKFTAFTKRAKIGQKLKEEI